MKTKKLVVFIPSYNEEKTIGNVIRSIPKRIEGISLMEILVVDDGSKDRTAEEAEKAGAIVVRHPRNMKLGQAFRTGIEAALKMKADIIVNMDGDGQFDSKDISKIIKPILENKADMVTCSRFLDKALEPEMPGIKKFGNNVFTKVVSYLTKQKFTDTQCGFRAYSKEAALRLTLFGVLTYTQEALLDLLKKGFRVQEVACKVEGERQHGKSKVVKSWYAYGMRVVVIIVRTIRDWEPMKFFGLPAFISALLGLIILFFVFIHWLLNSQTSPYTSLISIAGVLLLIGFALATIALIADMLDRQRKLQEEILLRLKRRDIED
ncbi:MAG: glycosyltransferase family 2 protein [archaeon]|nr:glycosyltransferase family 2 protein [archaeon]